MMTKHNVHIFLSIFLIAFLVHSSYFRVITFADNHKWIARTINLSEDILTRPLQINFYDANHNYRYGAHPGTTILLPAAILYKFGLAGSSSLLFAIILLTSLLTACIASTCYYLRPRSPWWLISAIILFIHPLYFYGTPTNVIIGPAIALLFLLALVVYEHRSRPLSAPFALFISFIIGLGLSTRLPDTVFITVPLVVFMSAYITFRRLFLIVVASLFFAFLFNPFFWFIPIEYIKTIILRTSSHLVYTASPGFQLTPLWVLYYTPLTIISLTLAVLSFIYARKIIPVSTPFLLTLFLITATTIGLFLTADFKTLRYFYPLIFIWDILLPLFLLRLVDEIQFSFITSARSSTVCRQLIRLVVVCTVIFGFGFLTVYNLALPGPQGLI